MPERVRKRLSWSPQWEGLVKGYARSYINQHIWRCDPIHTTDDLLQEAYLIYIKICERYPRVNSQRHFVSLFKTALRNYIHDLSRQQRLRLEALEDTSEDVLVLCDNCIGELTNEGELQVLCYQVPALKAAVQYLLGSKLKPRVRHNETPNMELQRVTGFITFDFRRELWKLLGY